MSFSGPHYAKKEHWTPRHFGDELHELGLGGRDESVLLLEEPEDTSSREQCCRARVRCPNCRRSRLAALLVDVRHVPDDLTDGASWACDACWTNWIRPSGRVGRTGRRQQRLSEAEWVALHGAPKTVVDHFRSVLARRKAKGQRVNLRLEQRLDLEKVTEEATMPEDLELEALRPDSPGGSS